MADLKDIVDFIKDNKNLLKRLEAATGDLISDLEGNRIKTHLAVAQQFVAAAKAGTRYEGSVEDRAAAVDAEIDVINRRLETEADSLNRMLLHRQISLLQGVQGSEELASTLSAVVIFTDQEITELAVTIAKAEQDIRLRKTVKAGIDAVTELLTAAASLAGKVATSGLI